MLEAAGCYRRRDDAIRMVCPEYGPGYKSKIVLPSVIDSDSFRLYSVVVEAPDGTQTKHRLTTEAYLGIVAATNFKQRVRKMLEYYHADRLNYAVDGDAEPAGVRPGLLRQAGRRLGRRQADRAPLQDARCTRWRSTSACPEEIRTRPSTTDTYSLPQSQEEFYFSLPYDRMDLCLYGKNNGVPVAEIAGATGLTAEQVERVFRDIDQKRKTTRVPAPHAAAGRPGRGDHVRGVTPDVERRDRR